MGRAARWGLVVGCELTLSTPGMLPGPTFWARGTLLMVTFPLLAIANLRLRRLLGELVGEARERFGGPVSYGAGEWERPDGSVFDVVGADRYRDARNAWRFEDDISALADRAHQQGKPCYVFEFGSCAYRGAAAKASTAAGVLAGRADGTWTPKRAYQALAHRYREAP